MMDSTALGLPLEYQNMPEYFDAHNIGEDTDSKNNILEGLLKKHSVNSVLDLTCGTGSQVFYLTERGYKVTGSDFSPALLDIAREKAHKANIDIKFIDGDMRTLKVGNFDAAITMFNAVGHLTKNDFETAMENIGGNLKSGGIYVFDIYNLGAMNDRAVNNLAMDTTKTANRTKIHNIQYSTLDRKSGLLTSHDKYTIQKIAEPSEQFSHKFTLKIYTASELRDMLARNGFETISQCGMDGSELLDHETTNILTVAKKH